MTADDNDELCLRQVKRRFTFSRESTLALVRALGLAFR